MSTDPTRVLTFDLCRPFLNRLVFEVKKELGSDLEAIALFGSVARDQGGESSDIDLFIVHHKKREPLKEFVRILVPLRRQTEYQSLLERGFYPEIMPLFMDIKSLGAHPWILLDVLDKGKVLFSRKGLLESELTKVRRRLRELGSRKVMLKDGTWYWDLKPDWKPGETFDL